MSNKKLNELSKETLRSYVKKAKQDRSNHNAAHDLFSRTGWRKKAEHSDKQMTKRTLGIRKANKQLDEISKDTLKSYIKKAETSRGKSLELAGWYQYKKNKVDNPKTKKGYDKLEKSALNKAEKRNKGIQKAQVHQYKEEVELQESLADLTNNIIFGSAVDAKQIFDDIAKGKIGELVQAKREEVAAKLFADLQKEEKDPDEEFEEEEEDDLDLTDEELEDYLNSLSDEELEDLANDVEDESDTVHEEKLDEISKDTLRKYIKSDVKVKATD